MNELLSLYQSALPIMLVGLLTTVYISTCAFLIGGVLGTLLGTLNSDLLRMPLIGRLVDAYVAVLRGTPAFVQILIVYFGLSEVTGYDLSPMQAGILALGGNSAAYLAEILRGGINAVPRGQWEACLVLGYSKSQALIHIIIPQAIRNITPAVVNEMISLIKESSVLLILGVPELTKVSKDLVAHQLKPVEIYLLCACLYLFITSVLSYVSHKIERSQQWSY